MIEKPLWPDSWAFQPAGEWTADTQPPGYLGSVDLAFNAEYFGSTTPAAIAEQYRGPGALCQISQRRTGDRVIQIRAVFALPEQNDAALRECGHGFQEAAMRARGA